MTHKVDPWLQNLFKTLADLSVPDGAKNRAERLEKKYDSLILEYVEVNTPSPASRRVSNPTTPRSQIVRAIQTEWFSSGGILEDLAEKIAATKVSKEGDGGASSIASKKRVLLPLITSQVTSVVSNLTGLFMQAAGLVSNQYDENASDYDQIAGDEGRARKVTVNQITRDAVANMIFSALTPVFTLDEKEILEWNKKTWENMPLRDMRKPEERLLFLKKEKEVVEKALPPKALKGFMNG